MTTARALLMSCTFLGSLALTLPATADPATEAMMKDAIAYIDASAKWDAKAASIATEGDQTVVKGLVITETGVTGGFTVDAISVTGAVRNPDGSFSLRLATATGIKGAENTVDIAIPELKIENFASPSFAGWAFDEKRPFTTIAQFYSRLAKTEFSLIGMPSAIVQAKTSFGDTQSIATTTLSGMRYENMKGGILATFSTGKVESATVGTGGANVPDLVRWEGLTGTSINFGGLARVFDPDAYANGKGDMLWTDLFASAHYGKLTVVSGNAEVVTMNGIDIEGLQARQTEKPVATGLDQFALNGGNLSEDQKMAVMLEYGKSFAGWARLASLKIGEIKAKPKEGGDVTIGSVVIDDLSPDGLKRAALEGLTFSAPMPETPGGMATGGLKLAEITGVEFPSMDAFLTVAKFGKDQEAKRPLTAEDYRKIVPAFFGIYPKIGGLNVEGASFAMPGMEPMGLDFYRFTSSGPYMGPLAAKSQTVMKGLKIPGGLLRMAPESAQIMDGLGYGGLEFELEDLAIYDAGPGAVSDRLAFTGKDMGTLRFGFDLNGITQQRIEALLGPTMSMRDGENPDMAKLLEAARGLTFDGLTLRFEDASLTRRAITLAAKMQGMDDKTFINNATAMTQLGLAQLQHPDFTQKAVAALNAFFADPKSLTISVKPAKPVGPADVMSLVGAPPNRFIDLLGVTVTAND